jgi:hypothetical protein
VNSSRHTDEELAERISRGDWGGDVASPALDTVLRLVEQRRRQRRTALGVGAGLAAAAAVTAVIALQSPPLPTTDGSPAASPTVSTPPETSGSQATGTAPTAGLPQPPNCTGARARLLLSHGPYAGTPERPSQVAFVQNIGKRPCLLPELPTLSIGSKSRMTVPVDMTSAGDGPWVLQPEEALLLTVTAPRLSAEAVCPGLAEAVMARDFIISLGGNTYTFNFPGMRVGDCDAPSLTGVRVGIAPGD